MSNQPVVPIWKKAVYVLIFLPLISCLMVWILTQSETLESFLIPLVLITTMSLIYFSIFGDKKEKGGK